MTDHVRCDWATTNPLLASYHDEEWGVPVHDDRHWFEKLILDGAQAGLSWLTILKRREGYRRAFHGFDVQKVARMSEADQEQLMQDTGIIRNRAKIESAVKNARAFIRVQEEFGSFDAFIWGAVGGAPIQNARRGGDWPARTELSDRLSKDLKKRGFSFVGSTIVYAFMQAAGLVNDHRQDCCRYTQVARLGKITSGMTPRSRAKPARATSAQQQERGTKTGPGANEAAARTKKPVAKKNARAQPASSKEPAPNGTSAKPASTKKRAAKKASSSARAPTKKAARRG